MTTKQRITDYLCDKWVSGMQLEDNARKWQTKASTISRRCRELAESGSIERLVIGGTVRYRLPPPIIPEVIEDKQGVLL